MDCYDEDLSENRFFRTLVHTYPDLFSQCIHEEWLICIPRKDSLPKYGFTYEDFLHHILKPVVQEETEYWNYTSLAEKLIELQGTTLILNVEVQSPDWSDNIFHLRKEILFQETFYTPNKQKYKVLCIASPLNSSRSLIEKDEDQSSESSLHDSGLWNLTSLRDSIDLLWSLNVLYNYNWYIKKFLRNHGRMETLPLSLQVTLCHSLYSKCLEHVMKQEFSNGKKDLEMNASRKQFNIMLATETYVLNGIYRCVMKALTTCTSQDDEQLNKITRNMGQVHPNDLNINEETWDVIEKAQYEISRLNSFTTPLGKITCLKRIIRYLRPKSIQASDSRRNSEDALLLSTDQLIPILVYLIVKNPLGNWMAQLEFMRNFRFASNDKRDKDAFLIASLEAALNHLKQGNLLKTAEKPDQLDLGIPCDLGEAWLFLLHQNAVGLPIERMLEPIKMGNVTLLGTMIRNYKDPGDEKQEDEETQIVSCDSSSELCHPLCLCSHCVNHEVIAAGKKSENGEAEIATGTALHLRTRDGLTLLHVACIYGRPKIVDLLIDLNSPLDARDILGNTPLHYAASRGHQNALLLLVHAGAEIQAINNQGDTPLHLSSQNGHENCVKALIYYTEHAQISLDLSTQNNNGETPLHYASKWGFQNIVQILVDNGASLSLLNKTHFAPVDCAHNIYIRQIMQKAGRKRSLLHQESQHGDFINIEMVEEPTFGRGSNTYLVISEPASKKEERPRRKLGRNKDDTSGPTKEDVSAKEPSKSRSASLLHGRYSLSLVNPIKPASSTRAGGLSDKKRLLSFPTDALKCAHMNKARKNPSDGDLKKLFYAILMRDVQLVLFYLGISPTDVIHYDNKGRIIKHEMSCHPLCNCDHCIAGQAGLGCSIDVRSTDGYTPLHLSVLYQLKPLMEILIRHGADINAETSREKKTAYDLALEKDLDEISAILELNGGRSSKSFTPAEVPNPNSQQKFLLPLRPDSKGLIPEPNRI